jgi:adenylate/guanylate cyclase family protein/zinc ribbon protein
MSGMRCHSCQHENPRGANFCGECGARLATSGPRASPPQLDPFGRLTETILASQSPLEGERKQITVVFADLKSSMELIAGRDAEEANKLLDPVLERMMESVQRYEGTTCSVRGDGIMALFGAPFAHEDHGIRACYAALRMQEAVKRYAQEIQRTHGVPIQIRVGLNSGDALVCGIGNDVRRDYKIHDRDDHRAIREKVTVKVLALDESLKTCIPAILALLDKPSGDVECEKPATDLAAEPKISLVGSTAGGVDFFQDQAALRARPPVFCN